MSYGRDRPTNRRRPSLGTRIDAWDTYSDLDFEFEELNIDDWGSDETPPPVTRGPPPGYPVPNNNGPGRNRPGGGRPPRPGNPHPYSNRPRGYGGYDIVDELIDNSVNANDGHDRRPHTNHGHPTLHTAVRGSHRSSGSRPLRLGNPDPYSMPSRPLPRSYGGYRDDDLNDSFVDTDYGHSIRRPGFPTQGPVWVGPRGPRAPPGHREYPMYRSDVRGGEAAFYPPTPHHDAYGRRGGPAYRNYPPGPEERRRNGTRYRDPAAREDAMHELGGHIPQAYGEPRRGGRRRRGEYVGAPPGYTNIYF
ncbi:MAG: hypothetical protein Q9188_006607 [Gyalolechia gomerana]